MSILGVMPAPPIDKRHHFRWMGWVPRKYCQGNGAYIFRFSGRLCLLRFTFRCSERPIICAKMKAWLCQGSQILPKCDVTRTRRPMRDIVYLTILRNLYANIRRFVCAIRRSQPVQVDRLFFISTCFYLSKVYSVFISVYYGHLYTITIFDRNHNSGLNYITQHFDSSLRTYAHFREDPRWSR